MQYVNDTPIATSCRRLCRRLGSQAGLPPVANQQPAYYGTRTEQPPRGDSAAGRQVTQERGDGGCGQRAGQLRPHVVHQVAIAAEGRDDRGVADRRAMTAEDRAGQVYRRIQTVAWATLH